MGQDVNIYYGVKKDRKYNNKEAGISGHSWIELNGKIFTEDDIEAPSHYHVTFSYSN